MLLNLRAQLRLRYIGWRTGEDACNAGEKVCRKVADLANQAGDKFAEGAEHCKDKGVKVKELLELHKDPKSRDALEALVEQQRQHNNDDDAVHDETEVVEEELVVEDVHDDTDALELELDEHPQTNIGIDDTDSEAEYLVLEEETATA